jgi:hypothetical protein
MVKIRDDTNLAGTIRKYPSASSGMGRGQREGHSGVRYNFIPTIHEDAISVGVKYPERVRIYEVPQIPIPKHPILRAAAEATQLISPATIGISLRYGIFIHNNFSKDRYTIVHELVHTMQCERFGGFYPFLKKYLSECIEIGYPEAPLEQEAVRIASRICGI